MNWYRISIGAQPQIEIEDHKNSAKLQRSYMIQADDIVAAIAQALKIYTTATKVEPSDVSAYQANEEVIINYPLADKKLIEPSPEVVQMLDKSRKSKE